MSIEMMSAVFNLEIEPKEKIVLLVLADYADEDGYCFPGQGTISRKASIPERTLRRVLESLEQRGFITRERRTGEHGQRKTDGYRLSATVAGGPTGQNAGSYRPPMAGTKEPLEEPPDNVNSARTRGTRIPDTFTVTPEMCDWLSGQGIPIQFAEEQTPIFVDYWRGRSGQIAVKLDWPATWRNWMRRSWAKRSGGQRRLTNAERGMAQAAAEARSEGNVLAILGGGHW